MNIGEAKRMFKEQKAVFNRHNDVHPGLQLKRCEPVSFRPGDNPKVMRDGLFHSSYGQVSNILVLDEKDPTIYSVRNEYVSHVRPTLDRFLLVLAKFLP